MLRAPGVWQLAEPIVDVVADILAVIRERRVGSRKQLMMSLPGVFRCRGNCQVN